MAAYEFIFDLADLPKIFWVSATEIINSGSPSRVFQSTLKSWCSMTWMRISQDGRTYNGGSIYRKSDR